MTRHKIQDIIVLLPGITGSVLAKDGKTIWGLSGGALANTLFSGGRNLRKALSLEEDPADEDDLGDGITATKLVPGLHLLPGLWKIDGYTKVAKTIKAVFDVEEGKNFFPFPYDWRRDNRVAARRLKNLSGDWLARRRSEVGADVKLILVAHSMGGLVSRYFLDVLGGWKDTRALITFGTPFRGSLNALNTLSNGMSKGPLGLIDLSELVRSFTSLYQLLPIYKCYDPGDGELARVGETDGIPNVTPRKAERALAFHREIEEAVEENRENSDYLQNGYRAYPIVGIAQRTQQSARLSAGKVTMLNSYETEDYGGDGTVPRVSATPLEYSDEGREMFAATKHAALQNGDATLIHLEGAIRSLYFDLGRFRKPTPPVKVSLDVEDIYWSEEPIAIRARPTKPDVELVATVTNTETSEASSPMPLLATEDDWFATQIAPSSPGAYRVEVRGGDDVEPVADAFAVVDADVAEP